MNSATPTQENRCLEISIIGDTTALDDYGAAAIYSSREASIFVNGSKTEFLETLNGLVQNDFRIIAIKEVDETNIHANCEELWKQERIGKCVVIPVADSDHALPAPEPDSVPLYIIPGMGFGTGHHPTTYSVIEFLQNPAIETYKHAIDIGTGSGLLAITIAKLLSIPVYAFDNDASAVDNAKENVALNGLSSVITLETKSIADIIVPESCEKDAASNLVCANLYSELLITYCKNISSLVHGKGTLILSGITAARGETVISTFRECGFVLLLENNMEGWMSYLFKKA